MYGSSAPRAACAGRWERAAGGSLALGAWISPRLAPGAAASGAELLIPYTKGFPSRLMRIFPVSSLLNLLTASLGE